MVLLTTAFHVKNMTKLRFGLSRIQGDDNWVRSNNLEDSECCECGGGLWNSGSLAWKKLHLLGGTSHWVLTPLMLCQLFGSVFFSKVDACWMIGCRHVFIIFLKPVFSSTGSRITYSAAGCSISRGTTFSFYCFPLACPCRKLFVVAPPNLAVASVSLGSESYF
jgi:hypothetical protein